MKEIENTIGKIYEIIQTHGSLNMEKDKDRNTAYNIYDYLCVLNNIMTTGDCNDCRDRKCCPIVPDLGQPVRHNCAFYKEKTNEIN